MIPALMGLPGKLKTVLDRLTSGRAANLDNLDAAISTRAAAATALSNATWNDGLANYLATAEQRRPPIAGGIILGGGFSGNLNTYSAWNYLNVNFANIAGASLIDVVNYTGAGVLLFLCTHNANIGPSAAQIIITRDGIEEYNGGTSSSNYAVNTLVGSASGLDIGGTPGFMAGFDNLPFIQSLRIQAKAGSSGGFSLAFRYRKTA